MGDAIIEFNDKYEVHLLIPQLITLMHISESTIDDLCMCSNIHIDCI